MARARQELKSWMGLLQHACKWDATSSYICSNPRLNLEEHNHSSENEAVALKQYFYKHNDSHAAELAYSSDEIRKL